MTERHGAVGLIAGLSISQVISWGVLYYALPATSTSIARDTGWSVPTITSAFSVGLVLSALAGIPVGRLLDRTNARLVLTSGTLLGALGLVAVALAPSMPMFVAAWALTGVGQSASLYQAAFTVVNKTLPAARRRLGITVVTLMAGLASTVFAPLAVALTAQLDWRRAFLVLAGVLVVTVAPIHLVLLPARWPTTARVTTASTDPRQAREIARSAPFRRLQAGVTLVTLGLYAVTVNLVPILTDAGHGAALAATAFGLVGVGQVLGRVLFTFGPAARGPGQDIAVGLAAVASLLALAFLPGLAGVAITSAVVAGAARGAVTLVQASAVVDRWGAQHAGFLAGVFAAPVTIASAVAPAVGVWVVELASPRTAIVVLAVVCAVGAVLAATVRHERSATTTPVEAAVS
ncbi:MULTISPECIES: MFS transporter [unclassified Curtobacterium]|uniref:MFS transporter n=1 Tax=unclassified Curtobacterium TaxID=257496 RepID=UPI00226B272F|nr:MULTISPECIES: MFS transporter [unclassified Curtobacterium]